MALTLGAAGNVALLQNSRQIESLEHVPPRALHTLRPCEISK